MTEKHLVQMKKVRGARMALMADHPFFGDIAFGLPIKWDDTLNPPTAATDGTKIIFHPDFVDKLTPKELVFVLGHEIMHPALMHIFRRGSRDPYKWNYACDIVVNYLLHESLCQSVDGKDPVAKMPEWVLYDYNLYWQGQGKVENIYDLLPKDMKYGIPGSGKSNNASMDAVFDADPKDQDNLAADWRNKLAQAAQRAKDAGKMTAGLEAFVDQMTTPKVPWQNHLRNFILTTRGQDRTWAKRNRRYAASNLIMPGVYGEKMGPIVFAIDCSGSTSDKMVSQCGQEILSIQEELRPDKIHIIYFDSDVKKHEEYGPDEPFDVKVYGRGGTAFSPIFRYIEEHNLEPDSVIVATDLYCGDFGPKPDYPVLWCILDGGADEAPWGQVLRVS